MEIKTLKPRPELEQNSRLNKAYRIFQNLIAELRTKKLDDSIVGNINGEIDTLNSSVDTDKDFTKQLKRSQTKILKQIEKEHGLVTKNHFRNTWLALGIGAFGVPLGVVFGSMFGNMGYIGIGIPIGMAIGIAIGTQMDQKANANGKQLDVELV